MTRNQQGIIYAICFTVFLSGCSYDPKNEASSECDARAIEHGLGGVDQIRHKNTCMAGKGYKRNTECKTGDSGSIKSACYSPSWQFWVEEEKLF